MHVVTAELPVIESPGGRLRVHRIPAASDNLVWVAQCVATGAAAVVDGPGSAEVDAWQAATGIAIDTVLTTHTHGDHIGLHRAWSQQGKLQGKRVLGARQRADEIPGLTQPVDEGDRFVLGEVEGVVLRTEGHIDDHLSYLIDGVLFCGDTLFAGGCGYLFDGPPAAMFRSLMRLAELPPETLVCCAHEYTQDNLRFAWSVEPDNEALAERIRAVWAVRAEGGCTVPSTVGIEQATNPFLRPGSPTLRRAVGLGEEAPYGDVFAATRALKDSKAYRAQGDVGLPLAEASE